MTRSLIALIVACAFAARAAHAQTLDAQITIDPQIVKSNLDPYDYCCANWVWTTYTHTMRNIFAKPAHYREFIRFLRDDVSIRSFRYPAGENVNYIHFGIPGAKFVDEMRKTDPPARPDDWIEIEEFFKFLADGDFRGVLQVNTFSWYDDASGKLRKLIPDGGKTPWGRDKVDLAGLQKAGDRVEKMARWIKANDYARLVRIFELGNEEYFAYSGEAYGVIAAELAKRIKKVLPDARIVVTNQVGVGGEWGKIHDDFSLGVLKELTAQGAAQLIAGATNHPYAYSVSGKAGTSANSTAYQEFAAYTSLLPDDPHRHPWEPMVDRAGKPVSLIDKQIDVLDANGFSHAQIYFTEFRLGGMLEQYNQAVASGIGNLQFAAALMAAPRVGGATIHSLMHASAVTRGRPFGTWGFDIINYQMDDDLHPRFVSTPVAEAFNLLWKLSRGDVLRTSASTPTLFAVATRDKNVLRLLVINRAAKPQAASDVTPNTWGFDQATDLAKASAAGDTFKTKIALPPDFAGAQTIHIFTLGDGDDLSARSVDPGTFNVHEVKIKSKVSPRNSGEKTLDYTFPPHSATLLELE